MDPQGGIKRTHAAIQPASTNMSDTQQNPIAHNFSQDGHHQNGQKIHFYHGTAMAPTHDDPVEHLKQIAYRNQGLNTGLTSTNGGMNPSISFDLVQIGGKPSTIIPSNSFTRNLNQVDQPGANQQFISPYTQGLLSQLNQQQQQRQQQPQQSENRMSSPSGDTFVKPSMLASTSFTTAPLGSTNPFSIQQPAPQNGQNQQLQNLQPTIRTTLQPSLSGFLSAHQQQNPHHMNQIISATTTTTPVGTHVGVANPLAAQLQLDHFDSIQQRNLDNISVALSTASNQHSNPPAHPQTNSQTQHQVGENDNQYTTPQPPHLPQQHQHQQQQQTRHNINSYGSFSRSFGSGNDQANGQAPITNTLTNIANHPAFLYSHPSQPNSTSSMKNNIMTTFAPTLSSNRNNSKPLSTRDLNSQHSPPHGAMNSNLNNNSTNISSTNNGMSTVFNMFPQLSLNVPNNTNTTHNPLNLTPTNPNNPLQDSLHSANPNAFTANNNSSISLQQTGNRHTTSNISPSLGLSISTNPFNTGANLFSSLSNPNMIMPANNNLQNNQNSPNLIQNTNMLSLTPTLRSPNNGLNISPGTASGGGSGGGGGADGTVGIVGPMNISPNTPTPITAGYNPFTVSPSDLRNQPQLGQNQQLIHHQQPFGQSPGSSGLLHRSQLHQHGQQLQTMGSFNIGNTGGGNFGHSNSNPNMGTFGSFQALPIGISPISTGTNIGTGQISQLHRATSGTGNAGSMFSHQLSFNQGQNAQNFHGPNGGLIMNNGQMNFNANNVNAQQMNFNANNANPQQPNLQLQPQQQQQQQQQYQQQYQQQQQQQNQHQQQQQQKQQQKNGFANTTDMGPGAMTSTITGTSNTVPASASQTPQTDPNIAPTTTAAVTTSPTAPAEKGKGGAKSNRVQEETLPTPVPPPELTARTLDVLPDFTDITLSLPPMMQTIKLPGKQGFAAVKKIPLILPTNTTTMGIIPHDFQLLANSDTINALYIPYELLTEGDKKFLNMIDLPRWSTVQQQLQAQSASSKNKKRKKPQTATTAAAMGQGDGESDEAKPQDCCVALSDHIIYTQHYVRFILLTLFDYELSQYELDFSAAESDAQIAEFESQIDQEKVNAINIGIIPTIPAPPLPTFTAASGGKTFVTFGSTTPPLIDTTTSPLPGSPDFAHHDSHTSPTSLEYAKTLPEFLKAHLRLYARSPLIMHLYHQALALYHEKYPSINFKKNALRNRRIVGPSGAQTAQMMEPQTVGPNDSNFDENPTIQYQSLTDFANAARNNATSTNTSANGVMGLQQSKQQQANIMTAFPITPQTTQPPKINDHRTATTMGVDMTPHTTCGNLYGASQNGTNNLNPAILFDNNNTTMSDDPAQPLSAKRNNPLSGLVNGGFDNGMGNGDPIKTSDGTLLGNSNGFGFDSANLALSLSQLGSLNPSISFNTLNSNQMTKSLSFEQSLSFGNGHTFKQSLSFGYGGQGDGNAFGNNPNRSNSNLANTMIVSSSFQLLNDFESQLSPQDRQQLAVLESELREKLLSSVTNPSPAHTLYLQKEAKKQALEQLRQQSQTNGSNLSPTEKFQQSQLIINSPSYLIDTKNVKYQYQSDYRTDILAKRQSYFTGFQTLVTAHIPNLNAVANLSRQLLDPTNPTQRIPVLPTELSIPEPFAIVQLEQLYEELILSASAEITPTSSSLTTKRRQRLPTCPRTTSTRRTEATSGIVAGSAMDEVKNNEKMQQIYGKYIYFEFPLLPLIIQDWQRPDANQSENDSIFIPPLLQSLKNSDGTPIPTQRLPPLQGQGGNQLQTPVLYSTLNPRELSIIEQHRSNIPNSSLNQFGQHTFISVITALHHIAPMRNPPRITRQKSKLTIYPSSVIPLPYQYPSISPIFLTRGSRVNPDKFIGDDKLGYLAWVEGTAKGMTFSIVKNASVGGEVAQQKSRVIDYNFFCTRTYTSDDLIPTGLVLSPQQQPGHSQIVTAHEHVVQLRNETILMFAKHMQYLSRQVALLSTAHAQVHFELSRESVVPNNDNKNGVTNSILIHLDCDENLAQHGIYGPLLYRQSIIPLDQSIQIQNDSRHSRMVPVGNDNTDPDLKIHYEPLLFDVSPEIVPPHPHHPQPLASLSNTDRVEQQQIYLQLVINSFYTKFMLSVLSRYDSIETIQDIARGGQSNGVAPVDATIGK